MLNVGVMSMGGRGAWQKKLDAQEHGAGAVVGALLALGAGSGAPVRHASARAYARLCIHGLRHSVTSS